MRGLVAGAAVVFVVLAGIGFDRYVVNRGVHRSRLAGLIVTSPPAGFTKKPSSSNQDAPGSDPFTIYRTAARNSPGATGAWTVAWTDRASSNDSATILLSYLPSARVASQVQAQALTQFTTPTSFVAESYALAGPLAVAGVPGAKGAVYKATGTAATPPVATVVFSTGRAQVVVLLGLTGTPASTGAAAAAFAAREYTHLRSALPGFSLGYTSVPPVATALYWGVALALLAAALLGPVLVRRGRRIRAEARQRAARSQHLVRGSKIARRQATRRR